VLAALLARQAAAAETGGTAGVTSDAIYRGLSESSGRPALTLDVHLTTAHGTFAGATALGTLTTAHERTVRPGTAAELTVYLGQRLPLGSTWNVQFSATHHQFLRAARYVPAGYQELTAQLSYLDLWSVSLSSLPDAVRLPARGGSSGPVTDADDHTSNCYRQGHYTAWAAATQLQWLLTGQLSLTAGAGYYRVPGGTGPYAGCATPAAPPVRGYAYGSPGLAYQWSHGRIDVGYFLTDSRAAARISPFPAANRQVAATLSWRF
jgi:hypothetical protein